MKNWLKLKKNPKLWKKFLIREQIIRTIREFFYQKDFRELSTPLLVPSVIPESYLELFETCLKDRKGRKIKMYLTPSPEASIKKLLAAGIGNCFEITKSFRNGETGSRFHNPEFTMLEWYRVGADYRKIMEDCEELFVFICRHVFDSNLVIHYQGKKINLTPPWERISVSKALFNHAKIHYEDIDNFEKISRVASAKGYTVGRKDTWETLFHQIYLNEVEPYLGIEKPTIIYDYPKELAALSKIKKDDPKFCERFEFYIGGLELGDCYTELTDFKEQKKRFENELQKVSVVPDADFLEALKEGLPPCSGIAVGIDRIIMLFTNSRTIQETLLFPVKEMVGV